METSSPLPDEAKHAFDMHLLAVLEDLHDGVVSINDSWCCAYMNHAAEHILQKKREDILGKNIWELFPDVVDTVFWKACYEAAETQRRMDIEVVHPLTGTCLALRISPSEAGVTLLFHEIAEHNQSTHDKQRSQLQASLIELASDAIIVRDQASTIHFVESGSGTDLWLDCTGSGRKGLTQSFSRRIFRFASDTGRLPGNRRTWEGELVHTCKNGTQVIVESRQVITRTSQNHPLPFWKLIEYYGA